MRSVARYRTVYILGVAACVLFVGTLVATLARTVPNLILLWQETRHPISELCGCQTYYSISTHPYFWTGVGISGVTSLLLLTWIAVSLIRSAFRTRTFVRSLTILRTESMTTALGIVTVSIVDHIQRLSFSNSGRNRRIMISQTLWVELSADERQSVTLHEQDHLQSHDPIVRWFVRGVLSPFSRYRWAESILSIITFYQERRADQLAIRHTSQPTLLSAFIKALDPSPQNNFVVHFNTNNERLRSLLGETPTIPLAGVVASVVAAGFLLFGMNVASARQLELLDLLDRDANTAVSSEICKEYMNQSRAPQASTPVLDDTAPMSSLPLCRKP